jgi:Flp pilus assembly pilin Flp
VKQCPNRARYGSIKRPEFDHIPERLHSYHGCDFGSVSPARHGQSCGFIAHTNRPMDEPTRRSANDKSGAANLECGLIAIFIVIIVIVGVATLGTKPHTAPATNVAAQP